MIPIGSSVKPAYADSHKSRLIVPTSPIQWYVDMIAKQVNAVALKVFRDMH
jgi:hypothetical protein